MHFFLIINIINLLIRQKILAIFVAETLLGSQAGGVIFTSPLETTLTAKVGDPPDFFTNLEKIVPLTEDSPLREDSEGRTRPTDTTDSVVSEEEEGLFNNEQAKEDIGTGIQEDMVEGLQEEPNREVSCAEDPDCSSNADDILKEESKREALCEKDPDECEAREIESFSSQFKGITGAESKEEALCEADPLCNKMEIESSRLQSGEETIEGQGKTGNLKKDIILNKEKIAPSNLNRR